MAETRSTEDTAMGDRAIETSSAAVHLEGVTKRFDDVVAVNDLDLHVERGEFLVLLGPSGCGKTTTLRMIAGLITPTEGRILIGEEDVTNTLPQNRDLSMVFQSYALYPHKTVRGNLRFPLKKMDLSQAEMEQKVENVARLLEIEEHLEKYPGQLSGGQRQRVAVGRTIVREPRIFLMDEPLSNLDAKLRVNARTEIRALQQDLGTTTLYVTHDQEEAMSVADRIAIMNDGELEQIGTPKEIYETPANTFVGGFVGEPQMNFLPVEDGSRALPFDEGISIEVPAETAEIGIRPEDMYLREAASEIEAPSEPVTVTVQLIELLGDTYEITVTRDGHELILLVQGLPEGVSEGSEVDIVFDTQQLHTFDSAGRAIRDE